MHVTSLVATSILAGVASAHGGSVPGAPKLFGRNAIADLRARNVFNVPRAPIDVPEVAAMPQRPAGEKRQVGGTSGQCGAGIASCAKGYCCSLAGWCGTGKDYCAAPDCQFVYGPACDANTTPAGTNTSSVARTTPGNVQWGAGGIYDCTVPGTVAITYDDGPYIYTNDVLDVLKKYNATATFFITGNNIGKGEIDNAAYGWDVIIKRAYAEGHQIASHTWSHQNLSQITSAQRKDQMYKNEMALRNILGFFPTYMRPPYSACDQPSGCWRDMKNLGYHVTYFDVDTDDYDNDSPTLIQNAKDNYDNAMAGGNPSNSQYLVIGHDIHEQTAHNLTEYMLQQLQAQGYRAVSVGECLGDPVANWYRQSSGSVFTSATGPVTVAPTSTLPVNSKTTTTNPAVTPTGISQDATCGGTSGLTCLGSAFGNCCSVNGWCGTTSDYCADGCQPQFGTCSNSTGSVSNSSVSAQSATPSSTHTGSGSASAPTGTRQASPDGSCGGASGYTCTGSGQGNCCSQYGYCGSTSDYCGTGCNSLFGTCGSSSQVSSSISSSKAPVVSSAKGSSSLTPSAVKQSSTPVASVSVSSVKAVVSSTPVASSAVTKTTSTSTTTVKSTVASSTTIKSAVVASSTTKSSSAPTSTALKSSTDGKCGAASGETCQGSQYGGCCGQDNNCGSFFACANGCQNKFGSCWFS